MSAIHLLHIVFQRVLPRLSSQPLDRLNVLTTHAHPHMHTHTLTYAHQHTHMHTLTYAHCHTHAHTHIRTPTHTQDHIRVRTGVISGPYQGHIPHSAALWGNRPKVNQKSKQEYAICFCIINTPCIKHCHYSPSAGKDTHTHTHTHTHIHTHTHTHRPDSFTGSNTVYVSVCMTNDMTGERNERNRGKTRDRQRKTETQTDSEREREREINEHELK